MNGAVSWKVFAYKFDNQEQAAFEELAYRIFCKKFHLREGLSRFYNQHYIETNPAQKKPLLPAFPASNLAL